MINPHARFFFWAAQRHAIESMFHMRTSQAQAVRHLHDLAGQDIGNIFVHVTPCPREWEVPKHVMDFLIDYGFVIMHVDEQYAMAAHRRQQAAYRQQSVADK